MTCALWLRGDLRLSDHAGFALMSEQTKPWVAFFNLDPSLADALTPHKRAYLMSALADLDERLSAGLSLLSVDPVTTLPGLLATHGIDTVYTHGSVGPGMRRRLNRAAKAFRNQGITLEALDTAYAVPPGTLRVQGPSAANTSTVQGYRVYTPFYRAWRPLALETEPIETPSILAPERLARDFTLGTPDEAGGERVAHADLERFLRERRARYRSDRDFPDRAATSALSTHLHFGTLHPRTVIASLGPDDEKFLAELAWREFYADVLHHHPTATTTELDPRFRSMQWRQDDDEPELLAAWKQGRTGYPLVDAGMRELRATHLMHNRVRMVTASFLIKDLHFDWRIGAQYFEEQLLDGDLASNRMNWQWVAGTGTDAAPYFRVFNPILQSKKFDPDGNYIRRWVPELAGLSADAIHAPFEHLDPTSIGYVTPIVDHRIERQITLARYEAAKRSD
ncbi:MAG: cryptochrome/photolyase family protein [Ferrimicrobium sp.]